MLQSPPPIEEYPLTPVANQSTDNPKPLLEGL